MGCIDVEQARRHAAGALAPDEARAVEEHASGCAACRTLLDGRTRSLGADAVFQSAPAAMPKRGDLFGRYVVLDTLGEGGMGVVYSVYDPQLDRRIALKLLRLEADSIDLELRLLREAQAMARLNHPNVV